MCTTLVDDLWVHGGIMYVEPDAHAYPDHLRNSDQLLYHLSSRICRLLSGPRFVAGDFNQELGTLDSFEMLRRAGFRELQDLALDRWGILPKPTCKGKTRK